MSNSVTDLDFQDVNPLDEAVNEKRYTQSNVNLDGVDFNKPIEEPKFTPPPFTQNKQSSASSATQPKQSTVAQEPFNPELKNLSKKETDMATDSAVNLFIQGYEWLHSLGNKWLQVSDRKLNKLQMEGEINLNAMIDYDYGKKMRAGDFFKEYNEQVKDLLEVSDEFKEEVRPVLKRVLAKKGIGLTDEQTLMFIVGKDLAAKTMIIFQQKQVLKEMIQQMKEISMGQVNMPPNPQPQQSMATQTPPSPQPEPAMQNNVYQERPEEKEREVVVEYLPEIIEPEEQNNEIKATKKRGRPRKI
jgi:hypothetical protein